ncbi:UNVERIFIED_CONTAM: hypothetical protein FKN15_046203 [Acipenser sinensis]
MVAGQPHFVRCIKPNNDRQASKFDREKVLVQLRYTGVLETAKIRRQGFSHRILFANFIKRYSVLAFRSNEDPPVNPETCAAILEKAKLDNWVLGKTKCFINLLYYISIAYRGHKVRKNHTNDRNKVKTESFIIQLQAVCRGYLARKQYKEVVNEKNKAATKIQARYRGHKDRKSLKRKREAIMKEKEAEEMKSIQEPPSVEKAQEGEDGSINGDTECGGQQQDDEDDTKAAIVLQSNYRGYRERKQMKERHQNADVVCPDLPPPVAMEEAEQNETQDPESNTVDTEREEARAATVIQSNFRGHKERRRLQQEGKIPNKRKEDVKGESVEEVPTMTEEFPEPPSDEAGADEEKAATVIQSNFRGHRDRKRLKEERDLHGRKEAVGQVNPEPEPPKEPSIPETENPDQQEQEAAAVKIQSNFRGYKDRKNLKEASERERQELETFSKQITKLSQNYLTLQKKLNDIILARQQKLLDNSMYVKEPQMNGYSPSENQQEGEEARAATVIQSNFRGHKERRRLQQEGKIPNKRKEDVKGESVEEVPTMTEEFPEPPLDEAGADEEKAATVIQSNFRGHRDRKRLKEERDLHGRKEAVGQVNPEPEPPKEPSIPETENPDQQEQEAAAVKIQSNFRGYKDRKNLKEASERERQELETFSKQITKLSQNYLTLQKKLNDIILARQQRPLDHSMYVKEPQMNGYSPSENQQGGMSVESLDSATGSASRVSAGKLFDNEDPYYKELSSNQSFPKNNNQKPSSEREPSPDRKPSSEPEDPASKQSGRQAVTKMPSTESVEGEDNPYDYRKLLRKTSQRNRLIKQF